MIDADGLRHQAEEIAAGRLRKARGLLAAVGPDERLAIETTAYAVALGVVDCLLKEAQTDDLLRLALSDTQEARRRPASRTSRRAHPAYIPQPVTGSSRPRLPIPARPGA
jgi:hypothetical protein